MENQPLEYWLSLALCSPTGTIAIHRVATDSPKLLEERIVSREGNHSEALLAQLQALLGDNQLKLSQMKRFLTASGPGSFTGLRIAMASLKAFALALNSPIETMNSAEARVWAWAIQNSEQLAPGDSVLAITQASFNRFTLSPFEVAEGNVLIRQEEKPLLGNQLTELGSERVHLLKDEICPDFKVDSRVALSSYPFPLRAQMLAPIMGRVESRRTYSSLKEWINLSPDYFGGLLFSPSKPHHKPGQ